jgi:hypothetical protein
VQIYDWKEINKRIWEYVLKTNTKETQPDLSKIPDHGYLTETLDEDKLRN